MTSVQLLLSTGTALAGIGLWLLLPRARTGGRWLGGLLGLVGLGLFGAIGGIHLGALDDAIFLAMAIVTVIAGAATISARNPVYAAIWFAMVLLGTAGLFLFQGAQFLGLATVVVYAGAILVTFLFVLMLAQPDGSATYDRVSWEALLSSATGAVLLGMLTMAMLPVIVQPKAIAADNSETVSNDAASNDTTTKKVVAKAETAPVTTSADWGSKAVGKDAANGVLAPQHVARLGQELYGHHLIAVLAGGALLMAGMVGAAAIVHYGKLLPAVEVEHKTIT